MGCADGLLADVVAVGLTLSGCADGLLADVVGIGLTLSGCADGLLADVVFCRRQIVSCRGVSGFTCITGHVARKLSYLFCNSLFKVLPLQVYPSCFKHILKTFIFRTLKHF